MKSKEGKTFDEVVNELLQEQIGYTEPDNIEDNMIVSIVDLDAKYNMQDTQEEPKYIYFDIEDLRTEEAFKSAVKRQASPELLKILEDAE